MGIGSEPAEHQAMQASADSADSKSAAMRIRKGANTMEGLCMMAAGQHERLILDAIAAVLDLRKERLA